MTTWIINAIGLFLTTVGAILVFLYLWKTPPSVQESASADKKAPKNRGLLIIAVGLLAVWLLIQYLALILL